MKNSDKYSKSYDRKHKQTDRHPNRYSYFVFNIGGYQGVETGCMCAYTKIVKCLLP